VSEWRPVLDLLDKIEAKIDAMIAVVEAQIAQLEASRGDDRG